MSATSPIPLVNSGLFTENLSAFLVYDRGVFFESQNGVTFLDCGFWLSDYFVSGINLNVLDELYHAIQAMQPTSANAEDLAILQTRNAVLYADVFRLATVIPHPMNLYTLALSALVAGINQAREALRLADDKPTRLNLELILAFLFRTYRQLGQRSFTGFRTLY